ncbi:hypothetical protein [Kosmotoga pacifica]|uniref:Uncharacterized protein n=1 Tax=Kosmotoga pacifica TaxID=1330330 RepID=A0A0G2Z4M2_9BACT|nr:hypothetical protein [Kosmotoga pacifica]AKI96560.1 hypothetical protein IX53_00570 [Kosmotoga pacifica]
MTLEGKIVVILSETEVIINIGLKDGVKDEMIFAIKNPKVIEVKDVDGKYKLGEFSRTKGYIIAKEVYDHFTYCVTLKKETFVDLPESFSPITGGRRGRLKVEQKQITEIEGDLTVRIGDKVIRI